MRFLLILCALPIANILWWIWADRQLRPLRRPRLWRGLLALFMSFQLGYFAFVVLIRSGIFGKATFTSTSVASAAYLWHLLILPPLFGLLIVGWPLAGLYRWRKRRSAAHLPAPAPVPQPAATAADSPADPPAGPSRRQVLLAALALTPPALSGVLMGQALAQIQHFRVRRLEVPVSDLPAELEGLTIAHLSDLHVGIYTYGQVLRDAVTACNDLAAELTLFSGDLINSSLIDLPAGIATLQQVHRAGRFFMVEGNHDLFDSRPEFEQGVRRAGLPLLINQRQELRLRGRRIEILGIQYGQGPLPHLPHYEAHLQHVLPLRQVGCFTILLSHHPHVFDAAAAAGVPLTLAGHTHGGQLMLGPETGAGPMLFRYWSGVYRRQAGTLVVSNGLGNWFPLRINAPAEMLLLRLRHA